MESTLTSPTNVNDAEASLLEETRVRRNDRERRIMYVRPGLRHNFGSDGMSRRRVDWRLLPILGFLYALALIDRTNISIARVVGLDEDLVC